MRQGRTEHLLEIIAIQNEIAATDLDLDALMNLVTRRAQELTGASAAVIELPDEGELVYCVATGEATPYLGIRVGRHNSLSGLCMERSETMRCEDSERDKRVHRDACRRVGARSMVCVPLGSGGAVIGVLKVYSPEAKHFADAQVQTLDLLGELITAHVSHEERFGGSSPSGYDALTGLWNRRAYEQRLPVEASRRDRYGWRLSLVLFDIDDFRRINDEFGHRAGDEVLRGVASVLATSRTADDAFRIGGDLFAVLMPHTPRAEAEQAAGRLVEAIGELRLGEGRLRLSYGIGEMPGDPSSLHADADRRLRAAKSERILALHG